MNNKESKVVALAFAFLLISIGVFVLRMTFVGEPMRFVASQHDVVLRVGETKE